MKKQNENAGTRIGAATSAAPYPLALLVVDYFSLASIAAIVAASSTLISEPCFS
jgi:hypothetical protein